MPAELRHRDIEGRAIAYRLRAGSTPTLLFLPGYGSDMDGTKAIALDGLADRRGLAMLRFDYSGTGSSGGDFRQGTLSAWLNEALTLVDELTTGPLIVVGSSMGGWLGLHVSSLRKSRVLAFVGIAAAPDFTDWGFTDEQRSRLHADGQLELANPYAPVPTIFTSAFFRSADDHVVLRRGLELECPVRLLHGDEDREVPLDVAVRTLRAIRSGDVQLTVLKRGGHRLSEPHEIDALLRTVVNFLEPTP